MSGRPAASDGAHGSGPAPSAVLRLHADVYPLDAIERTASAFSRSARVEVRPGSPHHTVSIAASDGTRLAREFANDVLANALGAAPGERG